MRCIYCNENTAVIDKRTSMDNITRRRRKCLSCDKRFTTKEVLLEDFPTIDRVIKPRVIKPKPAKPLSLKKQRLIELFRGGK